MSDVMQSLFALSIALFGGLFIATIILLKVLIFVGLPLAVLYLVYLMILKYGGGAAVAGAIGGGFCGAYAGLTC